MCNNPKDLDLENINTVAIDIETYDPNLKTKGLGAIRKDGFICGVAIATDKDTVYFPINHADTDKEDLDVDSFWKIFWANPFCCCGKHYLIIPRKFFSFCLRSLVCFTDSL